MTDITNQIDHFDFTNLETAQRNSVGKRAAGSEIIYNASYRNQIDHFDLTNLETAQRNSVGKRAAGSEIIYNTSYRNSMLKQSFFDLTGEKILIGHPEIEMAILERLSYLNRRSNLLKKYEKKKRNKIRFVEANKRSIVFLTEQEHDPLSESELELIIELPKTFKIDMEDNPIYHRRLDRKSMYNEYFNDYLATPPTKIRKPILKDLSKSFQNVELPEDGIHQFRSLVLERTKCKKEEISVNDTSEEATTKPKLNFKRKFNPLSHKEDGRIDGLIGSINYIINKVVTDRNNRCHLNTNHHHQVNNEINFDKDMAQENRNQYNCQVNYEGLRLEQPYPKKNIMDRKRFKYIVDSHSIINTNQSNIYRNLKETSNSSAVINLQSRETETTGNHCPIYRRLIKGIKSETKELKLHKSLIIERKFIQNKEGTVNNELGNKMSSSCGQTKNVMHCLSLKEYRIKQKIAGSIKSIFDHENNSLNLEFMHERRMKNVKNGDQKDTKPNYKKYLIPKNDLNLKSKNCTRCDNGYIIDICPLLNYDKSDYCNRKRNCYIEHINETETLHHKSTYLTEHLELVDNDITGIRHLDPQILKSDTIKRLQKQSLKQYTVPTIKDTEDHFDTDKSNDQSDPEKIQGGSHISIIPSQATAASVVAEDPLLALPSSSTEKNVRLGSKFSEMNKKKKSMHIQSEIQLRLSAATTAYYSVNDEDVRSESNASSLMNKDRENMNDEEKIPVFISAATTAYYSVDTADMRSQLSALSLENGGELKNNDSDINKDEKNINDEKKIPVVISAATTAYYSVNTADVRSQLSALLLENGGELKNNDSDINIVEKNMNDEDNKPVIISAATTAYYSATTANVLSELSPFTLENDAEIEENNGSHLNNDKGNGKDLLVEINDIVVSKLIDKIVGKDIISDRSLLSLETEKDSTDEIDNTNAVKYDDQDTKHPINNQYANEVYKTVEKSIEFSDSASNDIDPPVKIVGPVVSKTNSTNEVEDIVSDGNLLSLETESDSSIHIDNKTAIKGNKPNQNYEDRIADKSLESSKSSSKNTYSTETIKIKDVSIINDKHYAEDIVSDGNVLSLETDSDSSNDIDVKYNNENPKHSINHQYANEEDKIVEKSIEFSDSASNDIDPAVKNNGIVVSKINDKNKGKDVVSERKLPFFKNESDSAIHIDHRTITKDNNRDAELAAKKPYLNDKNKTSKKSSNKAIDSVVEVERPVVSNIKDKNEEEDIVWAGNILSLETDSDSSNDIDVKYNNHDSKTITNNLLASDANRTDDRGFEPSKSTSQDSDTIVNINGSIVSNINIKNVTENKASERNLLTLNKESDSQNYNDDNEAVKLFADDSMVKGTSSDKANPESSEELIIEKNDCSESTHHTIEEHAKEEIMDRDLVYKYNNDTPYKFNQFENEEMIEGKIIDKSPTEKSNIDEYDNDHKDSGAVIEETSTYYLYNQVVKENDQSETQLMGTTNQENHDKIYTEKYDPNADASNKELDYSYQNDQITDKKSNINHEYTNNLDNVDLKTFDKDQIMTVDVDFVEDYTKMFQSDTDYNYVTETETKKNMTQRGINDSEEDAYVRKDVYFEQKVSENSKEEISSLVINDEIKSKIHVLYLSESDDSLEIIIDSEKYDDEFNSAIDCLSDGLNFEKL